MNEDMLKGIVKYSPSLTWPDLCRHYTEFQIRLSNEMSWIGAVKDYATASRAVAEFMDYLRENAYGSRDKSDV